jgi:hypothetical protein
VDLLSRSLEPDERDAVRGDIEESGETGGQALRDVAGLVVRRQAALWADWRPWMALFLIVMPLGIGIARVAHRTAYGSAIYFWLYANNWTPVYVTDGWWRLNLLRCVTSIGADFLALACWSWSIGFVIASLSRRVAWMNGACFFVTLLIGIPFGPQARHSPWHAAVFALPFYSAVLPVIVQTVLVVAPSLWGMRERSRWKGAPATFWAVLWVSLMLLVISLPMNFGLLAFRVASFAGAAMPAGLMIAISVRRRRCPEPHPCVDLIKGE